MLKRLALALVLCGLAGAMWVFWPQSAAPEVADLAVPSGTYDVTILRDSWGVPHIRGVADADAAYGLAFAHAEDDFETIQLSLLAARGDLATHSGPDAAPVDYIVGLLKIRETVDSGWQDLAPDTRALLDAYADGVNHYAALNPDQAFPGVFPVTGKDVVAGFVQKAPLFFGIDAVLGGLFSDERPDLEALGTDVGRHGSNVMAVSPIRSQSGETMLAANSHQPWTGPVAWYEAHVTSDEGWDMTGALFPGMPVLALGHNRDLGWSFTVNHPDLIDVYLLETNPADPDQYRLDGAWVDFEIFDVPIEVRLAGRLHWTVHREGVWSAFGPVIRADHGVYAIRYAGMGQVGMVEQLYRMNKATGFEEWRSALESQSGLPSLSIGYADRTGTIAYLYHGLFPDRVDGYDWGSYIATDDSAAIWEQYLPIDELPWIVNPASGFILSANSSPFGATIGPDAPQADAFPAHMGLEAHETNRSLRARRLLSSDDAIDPLELRAMKFDLQYEPESLPMVVRDRIVAAPWSGEEALADAVAVIAGWDGAMNSFDREPALGIATLAELLDADVDLDPSQLIEGTVGDDELEEAFRAAVAELVEHHGRPDPVWGEVNRLVRGDTDLPLAGGPDIMHAVYGEWGQGRFEGIAGDSYVLMVTWDAAGSVESFSIHQFGSATLDEDSRHYDDQSPTFAARQLKPVWFDEVDIRQHLEREYQPGEG